MSYRPWLSQYDDGVPHSLIYPDVCVHDLLIRIECDKKSRIAIEIGKNQITYAELDEKSTNFAKHSIDLGVKQGEIAGLCLPNSIEFVIAFFGILKAGGVVAAMNPAFPKRELQFQVASTGLKVVVTNNEKIEDFISMTGDTGLNHLVIAGEYQHTGALEKQGLHHFEEFTRELNQSARLPKMLPSDPAVVQFSGGTTGTPKAALGSHQNLVANATQFRSWLVNLEGGKETFLIAIPLYHVYGLVLGLILGVATAARMVFVKQPGNVDEILTAVKQYPISYFPAVPSIFTRINQHPDVVNKRITLSTIKACISGSAPLLDSIRQEFESNTGGFLVEGYGLSEAPTATHCNPILGQKRSGSIGLPLPDVDCKIVSLTGEAKEVDMGKEGELWIRGPQVMLGYLNNTVVNKIVFQDRWLRTGDIARMDSEGYFYLSGRIKDLIKVHGMQVWPNEVEEVLSLHPAVMECASAGIPDETSGERVKIWVVLHPGVTLTLPEVIDFCRDKLAGYKIPAQLEIRDCLPRTPMGKVLRRILVEEHGRTKK